MKAVSQRFEGNAIYLTIKIPNEEIRYIYTNTLHEWFQSRLKIVDFTPLYQAMFDKDSETFGSIISGLLRESISYHDNDETFYHGFLLGIMNGLQYYEILSNRESGDGRPDILLKPYNVWEEQAVILELKYTKNFNRMEAECKNALRQIEERKYETGLINEGYQRILKYGICFCKKSCMVRAK